VRIGSWNVEYLMTPATHLALRDNCAQNGGMVGGDDRLLPCAITRREPRTPADYASLRNYATQLKADIVALQEVDGPDAAAQVFPGYDFCFSTRGHTQKNGFAIRAVCHSAASPSTTRCRSTTRCVAAWSPRSSPAPSTNSA
jgi:hypothetical protein